MLLGSMFLFLFVLAFAWLYAWLKGVFDWQAPPEAVRRSLADSGRAERWN
jgi:hypothetical protein